MFVKHQEFPASRAFGDAAENEEVYDGAASALVWGALEGGVGALFMYGQTGSGKTHTMQAIERMAAEDLFALGAERGLGVTVHLAYFEIAGKACVDLLQEGRREILLKENRGAGGGPFFSVFFFLLPVFFRVV